MITILDAVTVIAAATGHESAPFISNVANRGVIIKTPTGGTISAVRQSGDPEVTTVTFAPSSRREPEWRKNYRDDDAGTVAEKVRNFLQEEDKVFDLAGFYAIGGLRDMLRGLHSFSNRLSGLDMAPEWEQDAWAAFKAIRALGDKWLREFDGANAEEIQDMQNHEARAIAKIFGWDLDEE